MLNQPTLNPSAHFLRDSSLYAKDLNSHKPTLPADLRKASEPTISRLNPSKSYRIACGPCLATVSTSKLWKSCWRSTKDWQALLGVESKVPNHTEMVPDYVLECLIESCKPSYCSICMHGITVRTDMISELGIVLAWPCLDCIDVDYKSLGLIARRRGLATCGGAPKRRGRLGMTVSLDSARGLATVGSNKE
eukprot:Gb_26050 [translate_table: standard]